MSSSKKEFGIENPSLILIKVSGRIRNGACFMGWDEEFNSWVESYPFDILETDVSNRQLYGHMFDLHYFKALSCFVGSASLKVVNLGLGKRAFGESVQMGILQ
jgi:hypothetical protein